jgi:hypothetical protein
MRRLDTDYAMRVMDEQGSITLCRNVLFSINPAELGIEVIRPYRFELREGEWLMDGEILPSASSPHPFLVRRPVILISLEFLKRALSEGKCIDDSDFLGGKQLPEIPVGDYHVFAELDSRWDRVRAIEETPRAGLPRLAIEALEQEKKLITGWLEKYEKEIQEAQAGTQPLRAGPMTTLCPVSYKTLELAFKHHVFGF